MGRTSELQTDRGFSQSELMVITLAVKVSAELYDKVCKVRGQRVSKSRRGARGAARFTGR
jgi:hypothetical protein